MLSPKTIALLLATAKAQTMQNEVIAKLQPS